MEELVKLVVKKTGLSEDMAKQAVTTVVGFLKSKLPEPIGTVDLLTITRRDSPSSARPMDCATALT